MHLWLNFGIRKFKKSVIKYFHNLLECVRQVCLAAQSHLSCGHLRKNNKISWLLLHTESFIKQINHKHQLVSDFHKRCQRKYSCWICVFHFYSCHIFIIC
jgi:hypothetical protein